MPKAVTKREILHEIHERSGRAIPIKQIDIVIDHLCDVIAASINEGKTVKLLKMGRWSCKVRQERKSINGFTKEPCVVPAKVIVRHRPSKAFVEAATINGALELAKNKPALKG